ncbi:DUF4292 domain-containing protein [Gelatiniphilus marinus]|uniref:DUF4292 domain-containing protein n=1 Tax=Gelatiniphilus marinus TaxID=1759464 RepID=A0ABW5JWV5_9FLAO
MQKQTYIIFTLLTLFAFSCKPGKAISAGNANYSLSTRQLIKENAKQAANFKTLQAKLKISYYKNQKEQTHTVSFRAKKDEVLWISATFSVIRAKVTPEKVSFYNKLDNTYFEGDYEYLSELLGTELDYQKVQNLLFGEALFSLKNDAYKSSIDDNVYILQPKKQRELFEIFFLLDPSHFKLTSQQIWQPKERRMLQIDYVSYQKVGSQKLPQYVKINAAEATQETIIQLEFKNVSLNEDLRFPFKIPSGFKEIKI